MSKNISPELRQLLNDCINKDRRAQKTFYRMFYKDVMRICSRYASGSREACALLDTCFLTIFTLIEKCRPENQFVKWLSGTVINTVLAYHQQTIVAEGVLKDVPKSNRPIDETRIAGLSSGDLMGFVSGLDPLPRFVFNLYVIDAYTHQEISAMLDITEEMSRTYLYRAREALRIALSKTGGF